MFYGSWGRILEIDINKKTIRVIKLRKTFMIGFRRTCLGTYLYTLCRPWDLPLSAKSLIMATDDRNIGTNLQGRAITHGHLKTILPQIQADYLEQA